MQPELMRRRKSGKVNAEDVQNAGSGLVDCAFATQERGPAARGRGSIRRQARNGNRPNPSRGVR